MSSRILELLNRFVQERGYVAVSRRRRIGQPASRL